MTAMLQQHTPPFNEVAARALNRSVGAWIHFSVRAVFEAIAAGGVPPADNLPALTALTQSAGNNERMRLLLERVGVRFTQPNAVHTNRRA